ncbi:MAG: hypothetical protein AVO35_13235 [Candidatus Aegiribacteria sp. MLS_C]|nr:MAG: hypothetical protein AVO35_13235 [Candidatus Aegiribacteria sp. MLS_C]
MKEQTLPAVSSNQEIITRADMEILLEGFISAQDCSASSKRTYARQVRQYLVWLEETGRAQRMSTLSRQDILDYKQYLREDRDLKVYTVNGYLTAIKKLYAWLESEKIYPNIAGGVKGYRKPRGHRKDCLTADQLQKALGILDRSRLEGMRDYAIFNLMARTGLRDIEVSRTLVGDMRTESGQAVLWVQGKGRELKDEYVVLTREAMDPILDYLQTRGATSEEDPLFCSHANRNRGEGLTPRSISRLIKRILKQIGLGDPRHTAHSLRHTAITLAILGGAQPTQVQAMARHSDPRTTMGYYHNLNRIEEAAEKNIRF